MLNVAYVALGSNIGDRQGYLDQALELLSEHEDVEVVEVSTFIDTPAVSKTPQPHFLNAVVELRVLMSCRELFEFSQAIENKLGRV